jgi:hypothetical protein
LPHIRWQLEGEHGPAPDVGYELLLDDVVDKATGRNLDVGISLEEPESYLAMRQVLLSGRAMIGLTPSPICRIHHRTATTIIEIKPHE